MSEQRQNDLRASQVFKSSMAKRRADELSQQHSQLNDGSEIIPTEVHVRGGSIDMRMSRIVGSGKKAKKMKEPIESIHGGAKAEGVALAKHLEQLHGSGFLSDFYDGFKSVIQPVANIASFIPGPIGVAGRVASGALSLADQLGFGSGQQVLAGVTRKGRGRPSKMCGSGTSGPSAGIQVLHGVADSQLAPNVKPAVAYGNPPQAVQAFANNTVGMGKPVKKPVKVKRPPTARGLAVSKLMKEKGMSLGQASKHIKENGMN